MTKSERMEIVDIEKDPDFQDFLNSNRKGIFCVPESSTNDNLLMADTFRFAKWVKQNEDKVEINVCKGDGYNDLRSSDIWLPLVYLASDISLPIYLSIVANYLYDYTRGALRHDEATVHLEAIYLDKKKNKLKKFTYSGPQKGLEKTVKKFDLNKFMQ